MFFVTTAINGFKSLIGPRPEFYGSQWALSIFDTPKPEDFDNHKKLLEKAETFECFGELPRDLIIVLEHLRDALFAPTLIDRDISLRLASQVVKESESIQQNRRLLKVREDSCLEADWIPRFKGSLVYATGLVVSIIRCAEPADTLAAKEVPKMLQFLNETLKGAVSELII